MKIRIFVGNGFDCALGLKTGYGDFIKWCFPDGGLHLRDEIRVPALEEFLCLVRTKVKLGAEEWSNLEDALSFVPYENMGSMTINQRPHGRDVAGNYAANVLYQFQDALKLFLCNREKLLQLPDSANERDAVSRRVLGRIWKEVEMFNPSGNKFDVQFLNLNYTSTLSEIIAADNVKYVHGNLKSGIVLGVDRRSQGGGLAGLDEYVRILDKESQIEDCGCGMGTRALQDSLYGTDLLMFFGLSFGLSDMRLWTIVANCMVANKDLQAVVWPYDKDPASVLQNGEKLYQQALREKIVRILCPQKGCGFQGRIHIPSFTRCIGGDFWGLKDVGDRFLAHRPSLAD